MKNPEKPKFDNPQQVADAAIAFWGIEQAADGCRAWADTASTPASRKEWLAAAKIIDEKKRQEGK